MHAAIWFLTFICAVMQVAPDEFNEYWKDQNAVECIEELKFEPHQLNDIMDKEHHILQTPSARSYMKCMFNKLKMFKDDQFDKEHSVKFISHKAVPLFKPGAHDAVDVATKAIEVCKQVEGGNDGERLVNFRNCIVKELRKGD